MSPSLCVALMVSGWMKQPPLGGQGCGDLGPRTEELPKNLQRDQGPHKMWFSKVLLYETVLKIWVCNKNLFCLLKLVSSRLLVLL